MRCANQVLGSKSYSVGSDWCSKGMPRLVTQYDCFEAYSPWCKEQAQNDGQQEETLTANIASTKAVIKNNATKVESTSSDTARASQISSSDSELTAAIAVRDRRRRISAHLKLN